MRTKKWLFLVALLPAFVLLAGQAQGATVVYNLYATDGYVEMADGTPVYSYGFIGGRQGQDLTYTKGFSRTSSPTNGFIEGGAPAPTGGPWSGQDATLAGNAQFPAPLIYATVGDVVEIRLKNLGVTANPTAPNDPHSIHLHGLDVDAANDGVPETSVGAVPANLCEDGPRQLLRERRGNVIVYMFRPQTPEPTCTIATRRPTSTCTWGCTARS